MSTIVSGKKPIRHCVTCEISCQLCASTLDQSKNESISFFKKLGTQKAAKSYKQAPRQIMFTWLCRVLSVLCRSTTRFQRSSTEMSRALMSHKQSARLTMVQDLGFWVRLWTTHSLCYWAKTSGLERKYFLLICLSCTMRLWKARSHEFSGLLALTWSKSWAMQTWNTLKRRCGRSLLSSSRESQKLMMWKKTC